MDANDIAWDIVKVMSGMLTAGIALMFSVIRNQAKAEGKLDVLIGMMKLAEKNREDIGEIKQVIRTNAKDINQCFDKIRKLDLPPLSQQ